MLQPKARKERNKNRVRMKGIREDESKQGR